MELFLTGAESFNGYQNDGNKSLGGFQSSVNVPNNRIDFLFGAISLFTLENKPTECVAIILRNTTGSAVSDVSLKYLYDYILNTPNYSSKFEIAAVTLINNERMEKIRNRYDLPVNGEFYDASFRERAAVVKFLTNPTLGEEMSLLGVDITPIENETKAAIIEAVLESFINNSTWKVSKLSDDEIFIQSKDFSNTPVPLNFSTDGTVTISAPTNVSSEFDNEVVLASSLESEEGLGIWIKRTVFGDIISDETLIFNKENGIELVKNENLRLVISWS